MKSSSKHAAFKNTKKMVTSHVEKKLKSHKPDKIEATPIHDTSGGEMPDPSARNGSSRKDARHAFKSM